MSLLFVGVVLFFVLYFWVEVILVIGGVKFVWGGWVLLEVKEIDWFISLMVLFCVWFVSVVWIVFYGCVIVVVGCVICGIEGVIVGEVKVGVVGWVIVGEVGVIVGVVIFLVVIGVLVVVVFCEVLVCCWLGLFVFFWLI